MIEILCWFNIVMQSIVFLYGTGFKALTFGQKFSIAFFTLPVIVLSVSVLARG